MTNLPDARVIVDTAIAAADPKPIDPDGKLVTITVPGSDRPAIIDVTERLAKHADTPQRASGTHTAATVQSFIDLVKRHDTGNVTVWVHPLSGEVCAVLNDHGNEQAPAWGDHRVHLTLLETEEWKRWTGLDGDLVDQEAFAEHLQDGITEIAEPPAAVLLEVAQTMQGDTNVAWKSKVDVRDGSVQIGWAEQAETTAGKDGTLQIPTDFILVMAPFVGEPPVTMSARLRWRVRQGKLTIGYRLQNPERVKREALESVADRLASEFPGVVFLGSPRNQS